MGKGENHHMASACNRALHRWGECVPGKEKQAIPLAVGALGPTISEIIRKSSKLRYINSFRFRYLLRSNSIYVVEMQDRKRRSRHVEVIVALLGSSSRLSVWLCLFALDPVVFHLVTTK